MLTETGLVTAGETLALRRLELGLTQEELAARTDLSVRTIGDLERNRTLRPRSRSLRVLAGALGLDPAEVVRLFSRGRDPADGPVDQVLPRQLPMAPRHFSGRRAELRQLSALLPECAHGPALAAVSGPAGVGKSALAVAWAHQVSGRFPDGQLYADLHAGPAAPAEVTAGFLAALHVPAGLVPAAAAARAALLRSRLAGRRVLLVLDGARDEDQLLPLLPGTAGCLVLVTSRAPLLRLVAGHGAHPLALGPLPPDDAREYLTKVLGRARVAAEPAAVTELVTRHGPAELSLAAARAALAPSLSLTALSR